MKAFIIAIGCLSIASSARAQATRTWVSGVGDDANPCSRTAPCKTFAGAISKTAAGGEISVLDPGGFGALTITKSITLDAVGVVAGVLVSGTNGIVIQAAPTDTIILRGLTIEGDAGTGLNGVRYNVAGRVVVEDCLIYGFGQNLIDVALSSGNGMLEVRNTRLVGGAQGVHMISGGGTLTASLSNVAITGTVDGVNLESGFASLTNSVISGNSQFGLIAQNGSTISIANSLISDNATGLQAQPGSTIRISNLEIFDNSIGIGSGGGTVASAGNNRNAGNGSPGSPNATMFVQ
jgi:hypothetical protein